MVYPTFVESIACSKKKVLRPALSIPPVVQRGSRGPGHEAIAVLEGQWNAEIEIYVAGNSLEHPAKGMLTCIRSLIGGDRFLREETHGELANGSKYWRVGTLGYSNIDEAYEWVTQDGMNANMMFYRSEGGAEPRFPISMAGTFTEPGLLGEKYVGLKVAQRTLMEVIDLNRHVINLYFRPPGEEETLAVQMIYTRRNCESDD